MAAPEARAGEGHSSSSDELPAPLRVSDSSDIDEGVRPTLHIIQKRRDFLAAAKARRAGVGSMMVQGRKRREGEPTAPNEIRVGYTCSKKVGNAVARNRAKRRLRAVAAEILPTAGKSGWDYVLIGRAVETARRPYADMLRDFEKALRKIHEPKR